jgi:pterin-4a-carbinolamine dehydratase
MNHHPEFHNSYNVISFSFCTHDVGHKITDTDIKLAERLNEIAKRFPGVK